MRSMPKPNAKPVYSSGSMPTACEHVRVDHAAAAELDPAGLRAHAAAGAVAEDAADRELGRRLGEREERRDGSAAWIARRRRARG